MDVFKTKPFNNEMFLINDQNFSIATGKNPPYCQPKPHSKNEKSYYAVCPLCDNPIQLIGLYKQQQDSKKPYGRHHKGSIECLAQYDEDAYFACPFADPGYQYKDKRRTPDSPTSLTLYRLMRDEFDRIVYIWNKTAEIRMSSAFAEKLLESWCANEGWRYYESTYCNLSYMLLFAEPSYSLYGRLIKKGGGLYRVLSKMKKVELIDKGDLAQVKFASSIELVFTVESHTYQLIEEHLEETYKLKVRNKTRLIYSQTIVVNATFLKSLMSIPENKAKRNYDLLAKAQKIMEPL